MGKREAVVEVLGYPFGGLLDTETFGQPWLSGLWIWEKKWMVGVRDFPLMVLAAVEYKAEGRAS